MSTLVVTNLSDGTDTVASTTVVRGAAKVFMNLNGTGTIAVQSSLGLTSVTDGGTGDYTMNFSAALADATFAVVREIDFDMTPFNGNWSGVNEIYSTTSSTVRLSSGGSSIASDVLRYEVAIFR